MLNLVTKNLVRYPLRATTSPYPSLTLPHPTPYTLPFLTYPLTLPHPTPYTPVPHHLYIPLVNVHSRHNPVIPPHPTPPSPYPPHPALPHLPLPTPSPLPHSTLLPHPTLINHHLYIPLVDVRSRHSPVILPLPRGRWDMLYSWCTGSTSWGRAWEDWTLWSNV